MKKKIFNEVAIRAIEDGMRKLRNALAGSDKGEEIVAAFESLLAEIKSAETEELTAEQVLAKCQEVIDKYNTDVVEPIAESIAKMRTTIANGVGMGQKISDKVKREIFNAICTSKSKDGKEVQDAVMGVLKKNDISGFEFQDVVDYVIATDWLEADSPLINLLDKVPYTKFYYSLKEDAEDLDAHLHTKLTDKEIQDFDVNGKSIHPEYLYKRQRFAQQDMDAMEVEGNWQDVVRFTTNELRARVHSAFVDGMLGLKSLANVEPLVPANLTTNHFTFKTELSTTTGLDDKSIPELADAAAGIWNPENKDLCLIITKKKLNALRKFKYSSTSSVAMRKPEDVAGEIGVANIVTVNALPQGVEAVIFIPKEYKMNIRKTNEFAWHTYENNSHNMMYEENIAGGIKGLSSATFIVPKAEENV